jgi:hypothetical protein
MTTYYDHRDFGHISPNKKEREKTIRDPNLENGERTKGPKDQWEKERKRIKLGNYSRD